MQPQGIPNICVVRIDDPSSPAPFVNSFYSEFWDNGINRDQQKLAIKVKNTTSQKSVYEVNAERQAVMAFGETCAVVLGQTSSHCIHQIGSVWFNKINNTQFHETFAVPVALSAHYWVSRYKLL